MEVNFGPPKSTFGVLKISILPQEKNKNGGEAMKNHHTSNMQPHFGRR